MYFSFNIQIIIVILLSAAVAAALIACVYVAVQGLRLSRARRFCDSIERGEEGGYEPVSVIIYSQDEAEALEVLLRDVLAQDYPAPMEVIVVNEGESSDVRDAVGLLQAAHRNLYLTHTPDGARNLSRKKLAITLGVKAARHATVVVTAVGAQIRSDRWLRGMMRHFSPDSPVEVVIGYAAQMPDADEGRGSRCRAFDSAAGAARWLGAAIAGHPFRTSEFNVAYRREAFFRNKGFSRSLNLHYGDDDIFISEIANGGNTAVELGDESILGVLAHDYSHALRLSAVRRVFTEGHIRRRPRVWCMLSALCVPVCVACLAAAVACEPANGFVLAVCGVVIVALVAGLTAGWRSVLRSLCMRVLGPSIFPLALGYPLRRAMLRVRARFSKQKRYTWD